ncbi:uncharacterized protein BBA_00862 [Beauveria bassiana ARSEF 2860]|uniref:Uncharacterized protein n=1 Tax=Beauveria bassiana (strain ARSEF 2860) TaxID=655819 RepID=J5K0B7_BEAB2|nr:uncharacterized protein BBA_00862 [Beauveria bassiana ARSEF 2860]EJP69993.1 hypothetical protein BBA_00862 [Beauveria bassiana ARSEF 2860]
MFGQWPSSPEGPAHMVWRDYSDREIYAGARASAANSAALLINPKKEWESEEQYPRWRTMHVTRTTAGVGKYQSALPGRSILQISGGNFVQIPPFSEEAYASRQDGHVKVKLWEMAKNSNGSQLSTVHRSS